MNKRHIRCLRRKMLMYQRQNRAAVTPLLEARDVPALQIAEVDGAFFRAALYAHDAPDGGGGLEGREEVEDEAGSGVVF